VIPPANACDSADELRMAAYWRSGDAAYDSQLRRVVDYWFRYHVAEGVLAAA
jgi:hypothetical protein